MEITTLFKHTPYFILQGNDALSVNGICDDSRKCSRGKLFICVRGEQSDGHDYMKQAIQNGAAAIVVEDLSKTAYLTDKDILVILVDDTRKALSHIAAAWFGYPAKQLRTIGITGTKGKTSTAYMTRSILEAAGIKTGMIGTVETFDGKVSSGNINTTPSAYEIQESLSRMVNNGCRAVVMEVSSQGMKHFRCDSIHFDVCAFTNLKPDHIGAGEHKDFFEYRACKSRLFGQCDTGVFNADDEQTARIIEAHKCKVRKFSIIGKADYVVNDAAKYHDSKFAGMQFEFLNQRIILPYPGIFNLYNALCAAAIAVESGFGISPATVSRGLGDCVINGRCEWIHVSDDFAVMLDYAHNAMSLRVLLKTIREYKPRRLVCLFGCGGNRSKLRRFEMGEASGQLADYTIITSDNPRDEEPLEIIADIVTGIEKTDGKYTVIEDRQRAILHAIKNADKGDIIIIAGKGHETYQEIKGVRYPMDDRELIRKAKEETEENVC